MKAKRLLSMVAIIATTSGVFSQAHGFYSGQDLLEGAQQQLRVVQGQEVTNYYKIGIFSGYVGAVVEQARYERWVCISEDFTRGQILALAAQAIVNKPQDWHLSGNIIITENLVQRFPCN